MLHTPPPPRAKSSTANASKAKSRGYPSGDNPMKVQTPPRLVEIVDTILKGLPKKGQFTYLNKTLSMVHLPGPNKKKAVLKWLVVGNSFIYTERDSGLRHSFTPVGIESDPKTISKVEYLCGDSVAVLSLKPHTR